MNSRRKYFILPEADQTNRAGAELLPKGVLASKNLESFVRRLNSYGRKIYSELVNKSQSQEYTGKYWGLPKVTNLLVLYLTFPRNKFAVTVGTEYKARWTVFMFLQLFLFCSGIY